MRLLSHVQLFVTPRTVAHQAPLSMGFSRQEYWSGLPFPPTGNLSDPGIKSVNPALAGGFFTIALPGKPMNCRTLDSLTMSWKSSVKRNYWTSMKINSLLLIRKHRGQKTVGWCLWKAGRKDFLPKILYLAKFSFKIKEEIKTFPDKHEVRIHHQQTCLQGRVLRP